MSDPHGADGAPPNHIHIEKKKVGWLPWLIGLVALLALLFLLSRCGHDNTVAPPTARVADQPATPPVAVEEIALPNGKTVALQRETLNYELQKYLASDAPTPRTFTFDKLNFDSASSAIRPVDEPTLVALARILDAYPKAKVRVEGYADARGSQVDNLKLGADRAAAVASALVAKGVDSGRIATAAGGETRPVDTNATEQGRSENRRADLIVTAK
ncbi:OmpA family protein [Caulobacter flavus]|uniref:OmpA family protein n=1 Tax=Caulobacter flavus TaxID=1679497 RepID=A0A2N5CP15_9CAUL|nr:OmpA family protein [Caulobacter flavus]AYV48585.1 OmpA family protein [Caulobacter flavus]PLR08699.1 OmpA family protein [Caulobacter flavus]